MGEMLAEKMVERQLTHFVAQKYIFWLLRDLQHGIITIKQLRFEIGEALT